MGKRDLLLFIRIGSSISVRLKKFGVLTTLERFYLFHGIIEHDNAMLIMYDNVSVITYDEVTL